LIPNCKTISFLCIVFYYYKKPMRTSANAIYRATGLGTVSSMEEIKNYNVFLKVLYNETGGGRVWNLEVS
jgi:hypothetical protein